MTAIYDLFLHVLATLPNGWKAALAGLIACWSLTQWLKHYLPHSEDVRWRSLTAEILGFVIGLTFTIVIEPTFNGFVYGLLVGLVGPWSYRVALAVIETKFPAIRDALSQDKD